MPRVLDGRSLNRAVLARQQLLSRSTASLPRVLERVCGIQSQYAPSMYVGLWSRMEGFSRPVLDRALARRTVIQATLMRATIHLVSREDYWPFAIAVREARREMWLRAWRKHVSPEEMAEAAPIALERLRSGPVTRKELDALIGNLRATGIGLWVDVVRVPPAGTWERRRADVFALASDWIGPEPALSADAAVDHLVARYLRAFGPASRGDIVSFTGLSGAVVDAALARVELRRFGDLVDVPRAPLPDGPAPVRFLGTWDAALLVHARRAEILPEEHRPKIFSTKTPHSFPTFLVDGAVAGTWRYEKGAIELSPFAPLSAAAQRALRNEAGGLAQTVYR